jgi:zinc-binding in reverse transcriptase
MFIWRGHPIRVAFPQLILPKEKGGQQLASPSLKTKALFLANFVRHSAQNPFISQFLDLQNPPNVQSFPKIPYLKFAIQELSYLPTNILPNPSPKCFYNHFLSIFNTVTPNNDPQIDWKKIWKNLSDKTISSRGRAMWYILVNKKTPVNSIMHNQGRVASPNCPNCDVLEDITHKYVTCIHTRRYWAYTQNFLVRKTGRLIHFDSIVQPEFPQTTRREKRKLMQWLSIYISFIESVETMHRSLNLLEYHLENQIIF